MAFVIGDDCVMCGTCAANCPAEAISEGNGKYVINADSCMECGTCAANCPVGAISVDLFDLEQRKRMRRYAPGISPLSISNDFRGRSVCHAPLRTI